MLADIAVSLRASHRKGSGGNEVYQPEALRESAGGRIEASQVTRWRQSESVVGCFLHSDDSISCGRDQQATNESARAESDSNRVCAKFNLALCL
jgi:hypothetical protein